MIREATKKLVVDFPASVMDRLETLKATDKTTLKALILKALEVAYGIKPTGR